MISLYPYVREQTRQKILGLIKEEKKTATEKGDIQTIIELNKMEKVIETGGGIFKRENPYINFMQPCLLDGAGEKSLSLGEVQKKMKACAEKWTKLSEEEKKRLGKGRYEVVNLP